MEKEHADKCASKLPKYSGDRRNAPDGDERRECDCDGYHTFAELYEHRITLYIALCAAQRLFTNKEIWRSKRHSNGELCFSTGTQFVLGIGSKTGDQLTYHIPIERWNETNFALTYDKGPEWDGHTSDDVLRRLKTL